MLLWKIYPILIREKDPNMVKLQSWRDLLIITLYKEYPARDDFGFLKLIKDKTKEDFSKVLNYFLLDQKTFNIADFKQNKRSPIELKKPMIHQVSDETMQIINEYLRRFYEKNNKFPDYLITKDDGSLYGKKNKGQLSSLIIQLFHRYTNCYFVNIGINELRHAKVAKHRNDRLRDKQKLALTMRHSIQIHEQYSRESEHKLTIPCGHRLDSRVTKQALLEDETCSLEDFYTTNELSSDCVGRYVTVNKQDQTIVGKVLKNKKLAFESRYKEKPVSLRTLSIKALTLLPKGYTPLRQINIGKVVSTDKYDSRIEQNLHEETKLTYPYVITHIDSSDKLRQHLVYNISEILSSTKSKRV